jgi:malonate decarboxylase epsilon subunit
MLHDYLKQAVKEYLERASDALKEDVLMLDSPAALQSTRAVQLCLLISGVVSSALLTAENLTLIMWRVYQLVHGRLRL